MKRLSIVLLVFGFGVLHGDPVAPKVGDDLGTITTTSGTVYAGAKLQSVDSDGITILDADGGAKIAFEKLPTDLQKKFGYDPGKTVPYAEVEQYKKQIAQLQDENAELRYEISRFKQALKETQGQPKPQIGIAAFHCYLNEILSVGTDRHGKLVSGIGAGLDTDQATVAAKQQWGQMSEDQKMAYEKMAETTGDPIAEQEAQRAAAPVSVRVLQGQGE